MPPRDSHAKSRLNIGAVIGSVPFPERAMFELDLGNPLHIHQHALDITGVALQENDFETFAAFFQVPHVIETFGGQQVMRTLEDLKMLFQNSREVHENSGATHRIRDSISATFTDATTISCAHMTRIMSGNYQLRDAVPCSSIFKLVNGVWGLTRSAYALEESTRPFDRLLTRNGKMLPFSSD